MKKDANLEPVENEQTQPIPAEGVKPSLGVRLYYALFPIFGGLVLDLFDLMTFVPAMGPVGILLGLIIGFVVGYLICKLYRFRPALRWTFATLAALYCAFPMTEFIPVATIVSAISRFNHPPPRDKTQ